MSSVIDREKIRFGVLYDAGLSCQNDIAAQSDLINRLQGYDRFFVSVLDTSIGFNASTAKASNAASAAFLGHP
jgi:hypothetical protein